MLQTDMYGTGSSTLLLAGHTMWYWKVAAYNIRVTECTWTIFTPVQHVLQKDGFKAYGTIRSNRKEILSQPKLRKREIHTSWDNSMLFMRWSNKREVLILSTFHDH